MGHPIAVEHDLSFAWHERVQVSGNIGNDVVGEALGKALVCLGVEAPDGQNEYG